MVEVPYRLDGQVALITGASKGLGRHFACTLANAGATVAACGRSHDLLQELKDEISKSGGDAMAFALDVRSSENVTEVVKSVTEILGPIDILVNNAGIAVVKPAFEVSELDWDAVIDTNLKGVWLVASTVAKAMVENGKGGKIINISSIASTTVLGRASSYGASKAGVSQLTRALAVEWARHGIQVNAIAPGYILTEMNQGFFASSSGNKVVERIPQRRIGRPEDLDGALMLLVSDASGFMTGSTILVDGGHDAS